MIIANAWLGFQSQLCLVQLRTNGTDLQPVRKKLSSSVRLALSSPNWSSDWGKTFLGKLNVYVCCENSSVSTV